MEKPPPSNQDDVPTPKLSGSFAIMTVACQDSILDLKKWLPTAPLEIDEKLIDYIVRFKKLAKIIQAWTDLTTQEDKTAAINTVLELREEVSDLAKLYGHKFR